MKITSWITNEGLFLKWFYYFLTTHRKNFLCFLRFVSCVCTLVWAGFNDSLIGTVIYVVFSVESVGLENFSKCVFVFAIAPWESVSFEYNERVNVLGNRVRKPTEGRSGRMYNSIVNKSKLKRCKTHVPFTFKCRELWNVTSRTDIWICHNIRQISTRKFL